MTEENKVSEWDSKIRKAEKFMSKWHEHGRRVYKRYEDEREDIAKFLQRANIFFSNVNTLKESLFNSLPKPDVRKIHRNSVSDDLSRVCCTVASRALAYEVECAPDFEEAITSAVFDRLVPGMGQVWISFGVDEDENKNPVQGSEHIKVENVYWEDFIFEPCKRWSRCNWVGRKVHMSVAEFKEKYGDAKFSELGAVRDKGDGLSEAQNIILQDKVCVYEIWNRPDKKVYYVVKGLAAPLEVVDDPYRLQKFFPCPRPLIANVTTSKFLPVTDFHVAQDQYIELDTLYARISLIVKAIKVSGVYDSSQPALARMLSEGENRMIPVDNWAMLAEKGGIKGSVDWFPVQEISTVLQNLQLQFEAVKQILYEITGMSDIVRGASNQYETAAAQQIKAQFASVRMNGYQRDVAIFVRQTVRIVADMAFGGLYSRQKLDMIVGELEMPDQPFYEQALQILGNDLMAKYRVDIQANSLTQADWALEKQERMDAVQTLGNMVSQVLSMENAPPELQMLAVQMVKFAISGFRGAHEFESWVDMLLDKMSRKMQEEEANPKPAEPSPEEKKMQMEMQMKQQEAQTKMQMEQQKMQLEVQKAQMELAHQQQMNQMDIEMKAIELQMKQQESQMDLQIKRENAQTDLAVSQQQAAMGLEQSAATFDQKSQQQQESHEMGIQQAKEKAKTEPKKPKGKE